MADPADLKIQLAPGNGNGFQAGNGGNPASNDDKPAKQPPRKRVSQACDKCRSRKDKCDGKKPSCTTCITNGRECAYDANVKKRGLPEGYVRGLEKLWGIAIRDVDSVEEQVLSTLIGDPDSKITPLSVWNDEANSEALVELWRKSGISRELERLLSSQDPSSEPKRRRANEVPTKAAQPNSNGFQQSSTQPSNHPKHTQSDDLFDSGRAEHQHDRPPTAYQASPQFSEFDQRTAFLPPDNSSNYQVINQSNEHVGKDIVVQVPELPSETWQLLDIYFSYTHSWLPIIEKPELLRVSYQYSQYRDTGSAAVLWAVIAYSKLQNGTMRDHSQSVVRDDVLTAEGIYKYARSLVPNEEGSFEIGHVQALLVLSLVNMGLGFHSKAWSLIGQAVRVAIDIGLDEPLEIGSGSKAKSRSKHVFLGCFALDTLIAARLNRRPHLRRDDIEGMEVEVDGLEEWDPWNDCASVRKTASNGSRTPAAILSTFNQLISVLKILNDAICWSPSSTGPQASTALLEKLHVYSKSQSPPFYFDSAVISSEQNLSLLPHQYHLHSVYFTTLTLAQLLSHRNSQQIIDLEPCTRSGRHTVELIKQHSNSFGLLIIPPTYEYFVKTAYDVVDAVDSSIESTHIILNDWRRDLDLCLEAMEPTWPAFGSFKSSIRNTVRARTESQVAFDLFGGTNQGVDIAISETPRSVISNDIPAYSPASYRSQAVDPLQQPRNSTIPARPTTGHMQRTSFGQTSSHGLPMNPLNIYENAHAPYQKSHASTGTNNTISKSGNQQFVAQSPIELTQPVQPQHHRTLTMSSADVEFDPMFNELMRLDATEWAGNWDQSLVNLGFAATDDMNQDFLAFCQDPDPLSQNNVFQQLVANSNAESTDFFDGSIFGGGFGGLAMPAGEGDETEGIEAGQILQALSAAEDLGMRGTG